eukprot:TRINITY_DN64617_c0_g2_i2.p1 TRINITY_DN64617_c0_g2~~TRINITY_DN64617_c0_g2_i2.p1  ORF type:complete len:701 (-),score=99.16 TRINITY_DN64617_c0_g2_i2:40-2142(-)
MLNSVDEVMQMVDLCVQDGDPQVRQAVCIAVSDFAAALIPNINAHYDTILQYTVRFIEDPNEKVQEKACFILETTADSLNQQALINKCPDLLAKLSALVGSAQQTTKDVAISAVGTLAAGVGESFRAHAPQVLPGLLGFMEKQEEQVSTRARAAEAVGVIANSIGRDSFNQYAERTFDISLKCVEEEEYELSEHVFGLWANLSEVYGQDWLPHSQKTLKAIHHAITAFNPEEIDSGNPFSTKAGCEVLIQDDGDEEDEDDDGDGIGDTHLRIHRTVLEMKAAATHCIAAYAKNMREALYDQLQDLAMLIQPLLQYFFEDVRVNAVVGLKYLSLITYYKFQPEHEFDPKTDTDDTLHKSTRDTLNLLFTQYFALAFEDDSKEVVAAICESITDITKTVGPVALWELQDKWVEMTACLLQKQSCSQLEASDDEGDEDEDEHDHDQILIDSVAEMVDMVAKAFGSVFAKHWQSLFPHVEPYLSESRPPSDQYMALATYAEVAEALGDTITTFIPKMLPKATKRLKSAHGNIRSNAAYCVGALCCQVPLSARQYYAQIVPTLVQLAGDKEALNAADNAVAALARMILVDHEVLLKEAPQLVDLLVGSMPLKADYLEYERIWKTIIFLLQNAAPLFAEEQRMKKVMEAFVHTFFAKEAADEVKNGCASCLQSLIGQNQGLKTLLSSVLQAAPPGYSEAVKKFVFW